MTLSEHLGELRSRLLKCVISVVVLGAASLVFAKQIYGLLMRPVLASLPPQTAHFIYTSAIEELNVYMKVGLYTGLFLSTPVVLWQLWGFISPGLYPKERRLAGPFVVFGSAAFLAGAAFCYLVLLPTMFQFLLREEGAASMETQLDAARLKEQDAIRYLRMGELARAGKVAKETSDALGSRGVAEGDMGLSLVPKERADVLGRLEGLGRLLDAAQEGLGPQARPVLREVVEKRLQAVEAFSEGRHSEAVKLTDEAASRLTAAAPARTSELFELWRLEKALGTGRARYEAMNWTRPMLSMNEQLSLVLLLELALGIIFELPLVMALLGLAGLVQAKWLMRYQRHALVVCLILAAVITPTGDAVNLAMLGGPMLLCYELGVLAVWLIERRRKSADASAAAS
ncbi:MAG: twin-arginine translocase subunit TatC [Myxococcales bacterium]|nr:twin-arginine translocase subunit TatC [Myxococcales bacterium]